MTVHGAIGNGFQKVIYQRAMEIEFSVNNIRFSREHEIPIFYKKVDFLVEDVISVELKALFKTEDIHPIS
jgi:GxxExxY protein